nr:MAG TPA: hypothetical protein [Caudoviricetes sp.]
MVCEPYSFFWNLGCGLSNIYSCYHTLMIS